MTVRDWISGRTPAAPPSLLQQVLRLLGPDASEPEERTAEVCLETAVRALDDLVRAERFTREDASELLAIDALTTYAFEHASQSKEASDKLEALANRGARLFAQVVERV